MLFVTARLWADVGSSYSVVGASKEAAGIFARTTYPSVYKKHRSSRPLHESSDANSSRRNASKGQECHINELLHPHWRLQREH